MKSRAPSGLKLTSFEIGVLALVFLTGCRSAPLQSELVRFDDSLESAKTSAPTNSSSVPVTEPVKWDFSERNSAWMPVRGRAGFRKGSLVLMGQGKSPVLRSPEKPAIDWSQFRALRIRMLSEGGQEIRMKVGEHEQRKRLGPSREFHIYEFSLSEDMPSYVRQLELMPTDSTDQPVEIDYVEITPRLMSFSQPVGQQFIGKGGEFRSALYASTPSVVEYRVTVPERAELHCGLSTIGEEYPVRFRIYVKKWGLRKELFLTSLQDSKTWKDVTVDLSAYQGQTLHLGFQTESDGQGQIGLWSTPRITKGRTPGKANVVLYVVDTLRADHTSLYGYRRQTTPFLQDMSRTSVVFEDCHVQATWTKPSVASLMTSLYSVTHGIAEYGDGIPKGAVTLAEVLRKAGYVTASFVSNPFAGRNTDLQRGFDYLTEYTVIDREIAEEERATDSAALNRKVFPWLEKHKNEKFFLYLHSTDPHAPYHPPESFESGFANPAETSAYQGEVERMRDLRHYGGGAGFNRHEFRKNSIDPDKHVRRASERYDGEITQNDRSIELLMEKLRALGIHDDTLVIIVSDHGEEFLEHGWTSHGHSLYQELTHALFLMSNPKLLAVPRRVTEPVQLIDVVPTILDLLGIDSDGIMQGQSLAPLARGLPFKRKGPVISSRLPQPGTSSQPVPENLTRTFAWIGSDWKLIYRDQAKAAGLKEVELYDRRTDRNEHRDLSAEKPEVVKNLKKEILDWIKAQESVKLALGERSRGKVDAELMKKLRTLGYASGK